MTFEEKALIWAVHRARDGEHFDHVVVMRQGKIVEQGSFAELNVEGTFFKELLSQE